MAKGAATAGAVPATERMTRYRWVVMGLIFIVYTLAAPTGPTSESCCPS